jgi:outer membrane protein OmpA-like peptidoglycan-associated protein
METPRRERVRTEEPVGAYAQPAPEERSGGGSGWRWALATVAALLLLWAVWPRNRHQVATAPDTTHTGYAGGEVTPPAAAVTPGLVKLQLPNGTTIEVPDNGPEARLVGFLKDPSRHADDTTWFELTQMQFETNSATLKPESDAQLKNIALIMQAYPNASARIGGYTDNTGNAAANKRLSQERASNVRLALVNLGVGAAHLTAEGYGPEHPIADNSTEEGRAHNRRIALRVTQK